MESKDKTYLGLNDAENTLNQFNSQNQREENSYITSLINRYRQENIFLKKYIQIVNTEIRKHLKLESIPSLEEAFNIISKKRLSNSSDQMSQEAIDEWFNRLFNVEQIEPLSVLYETYIKNLQDEINYKTQKLKEFKDKIANIVNENNDLRDTVHNLEEQLKGQFEKKINTGDSSSILVLDEEYLRKIEARNDILSRENEILTININKLQNEIIELKVNSNNAYIEQRNNKTEEINRLYLQSKEEISNLQKELEISKQKLYEITDKNSNLEDQNENLRHELNSAKEINQRYVNMLNQKDD